MLRFRTKTQPDSDLPDNDCRQEVPVKPPQAQLACDWWTPDMDQSFETAASAAALEDHQLEVLKKTFVESICHAEAEEEEEISAKHAETLTALEKAWGQDADRNFAAANQAAAALHFGERAMSALLLDANAVQIVQALATLGDAMAEDGALPSRSAQGQLGKVAAEQDLDRLKSDKEHVAAFLNPSHPGHQQAKRQRRQLIDATLRR